MDKVEKKIIKDEEMWDGVERIIAPVVEPPKTKEKLKELIGNIVKCCQE